ncbi:MAG: helix-turn-helix domain-containing protein [Clostridiales bacterium]|nr:helix-turn-helix domain-containing protein [Clostridiales bacterium]
MNRIKALRSKKQIKQIELASAVNVSQAALSGYETGKYEADLETYKRIANFFGVSLGYLLGDDEPTSTRSDYIRIPVLGRVAAGIPIDAIEEVIDWEDISADMAVGGAEYFGLQIKGDSMEPKISSGDIVIVRKQPDVESGEVAVVLVNGDDATVKKVKKSAAGITLIANNPAYDPLFYSNEDIEKLPVVILGRVVELRARI